MIEIWLIFALVAALLYGISQAVGKFVIDRLSAPMMIFLNFIVTMPVYLFFLAMFLIKVSSWPVDLEAIGLGLLAALFGRAGYYTFLEAVERGPITIVGSLTAAYPAIITILAITLLGETVTAMQAFGVAVIICGMIGLSYSRGGSTGRAALTRASLIFSLITLALWGIWGIFVKLTLDVLPVVFYLGLYALVLPPLFFVYSRSRRWGRSALIPKWSIPVIIAIISIEIGQIGLFADTTSVSLGEAAIVFPLIASYPVVMILLAYGFLKERLTKRDLLLVVAVVAGIVLVSTV